MAKPGGLEPARNAIEAGRWQLALDLLDGLGDSASAADALELRAQAAYGNGQLEAAVSAWEDLYAVLMADGEPVGAARAAAMIAMYLMMDTGLMAPVRGWTRRAERLLEGQGETPAHAVIAMVRTYERFMSGDLDGAREQAASAIDLGTRHGVAPAVVIGRVATARVVILGGQVDAGLELLDEIATLLMSGEVDSLTTGMMYCELICAAQGLAMHDRAAAWTDVMERWRHGAAFGGINGRCRVHRAEMLRFSGPCDLAEEEALGACDELRPWMRREFGWPLAELGNIRLRRGDLAGAEEAFLAAHEHAWSPYPGLALLRLAQGRTDTAATLIADAIEHPLDIPSKERPPFGDLRLAPLLEAQVEIAASAGDEATARRAAEALDQIASRYPSRSLGASAALAQARAALSAGEVGRAVERGTQALVMWADVGAPFETAMARMVLGDGHAAAGNPDSAQMEWRAARAAFDAYGAALWAARADRLLAAVPSEATAAPAPTSATAKGTFSVDGDLRSVAFAGSATIVRDLVGFRYLARLLAEPGREFHALDLVAVEQGTLPVARGTRRDVEGLDGEGGAALPLLDDQARRAYQRRLAEVDDDIDEATRMNDSARAELAQRDREYLIAELTHAAGFAGRHRSTGGTAERARTSVTRSIRYALGRLAEHHPALARHLQRAVRTGTYCSYSPDQLAPVTWET